MLIIGLTGGIGSGKSSVTELFSQLNVPILDADLTAHQLTQPGTPAYQEIVTHFGDEIIQANGTLNRAYLRELIFTHASHRQWLEKLLHPLIEAELIKEINKLSAPYCIVVIPLLIEVGRYKYIDRILVIDTSEELQIQRVMQRDKISREIVEKILGAQAKRAARIAKADDIIHNMGDKAALVAQVNQLHQKYLTFSPADP